MKNQAEMYAVCKKYTNCNLFKFLLSYSLPNKFYKTESCMLLVKF